MESDKREETSEQQWETKRNKRETKTRSEKQKATNKRRYPYDFARKYTARVILDDMDIFNNSIVSVSSYEINSFPRNLFILV